jgi:hypothetical protein
MNIVTDNSQVIADLIKERDELKAHCNELLQFISKDIVYVSGEQYMVADGESIQEILSKTPQQSLAEHDANLLQEELNKAIDGAWSGSHTIERIQERIKQLREQSK